MPQVENHSSVNFVGDENEFGRIIKETSPDLSFERAPRPDLGQILLPIILRWWFLLVVPLICGGLGYYLVGHNTIYYQGRMLIGVGPAVKEINTDVPELLYLRLTASYIQLVSNDRFLQAVVRESHTNLDLDSLRQSIVASAVKDTPYFEFQIVGIDPDELLKILGSIRDLLLDESPQAQELRNQSQQAFLKARTQELNSLIQARSNDLSNLENNPNFNPATDAATQSPTETGNSSASAIRAELDTYNKELSEISQYNTNNVLNQLHVVESPHLLIDKLGAQPKDGALALGGISLALVIILVWLMEKYDPCLRYSYQVAQILGQSILMVAARKTGWGKLLRGRGRSRKNENAIELVASELLVRANYFPARVPTRYRLLVLVEKHSVESEPQLNNLAMALVGLGINCSIRDGITGETVFFKLPETEQTFIPTTETGLALNTINPFELRLSWELVRVQWPVALPIAGNLIRQADDLLVVCSLKKSSRQSLYKLRDFLAKTPCRVAGTLLI
jgi:hypothetical protein